MTIKQLFKNVDTANDILVPLTHTAIFVLFSSDMPHVAKSRVMLDTFEDFERHVQYYFKKDAASMLNMRFEKIRNRIHFGRNGYIELFIGKTGG